MVIFAILVSGINEYGTAKPLPVVYQEGSKSESIKRLQARSDITGTVAKTAVENTHKRAVPEKADFR
ncbi:hypothetical protein Q31b_27120 [Novipirellula aureliae]|uniref:Uncharacterized protein n=1 Tax=Novipirellula aureliae TaxID=2527966 RepID=A0A5C6DV67_9BACT|nr:hypothetical protein [Novipirellula aureliae]TWU41273.1 hypothetical protein Q31b_27120 [Novipirellula aureliae]